jgi:hypothetical protein
MVRKYMDSGFAAGFLRVHDPACDHPTSEAAQRCKRKVLVPGAHEPIITGDVWAEYRRQRGLRAKLPAWVESPVYPLAGMVRCGRCGAQMNAHGMRDRGVRKPGYLYQCTRYARSRQCKGTWIARHRVEDVVLAWLAQFAADIEQAAKAERGRARVRRTAEADRKRLAARAARLDADLTNLAIRLARDLIPEDTYVKARDRLLAEQRTVTDALDAIAPPAPGPAPLAEAAAGLLEGWPGFRPERQRALLAEMIDHVSVVSHGKGRATVTITARWGEVWSQDI